MCVVVLQNCMGCVEGATCSCSATCDADGAAEDSIKVEEAIDTRGEIPEAVSFPPINTEPEVKLWGFFVKWWQRMFLRPFIVTKRKF